MKSVGWMKNFSDSHKLTAELWECHRGIRLAVRNHGHKASDQDVCLEPDDDNGPFLRFACRVKL